MKYLILILLVQGCATTDCNCSYDWKEYLWQFHKVVQLEHRTVCYQIKNLPGNPEGSVPMEMEGSYCLSKDENQ
jgi:hypothetical protein